MNKFVFFLHMDFAGARYAVCASTLATSGLYPWLKPRLKGANGI